MSGEQQFGFGTGKESIFHLQELARKCLFQQGLPPVGKSFVKDFDGVPQNC